MGLQTSHRDLLAWQEALRLVEVIYRETRHFPAEETFGLTAQMRRAALSIPCNIAEGAGRNSRKELAHFLGIASGSRAELETQVELALRLGYLKRSDAEICGLLERVGKLLVGLRKVIRTTQDARPIAAPPATCR